MASKPGASGPPPSFREEADALIVSGPAGELRFDRRTGDLAAWKRGAATAPVAAGPMAQAFVRRDRAHMPVGGNRTLVSLSARTQGRAVVVDARYTGTLRQATWTFGAGTDAVQLDYEYAFDGNADLVGVSFALPATGITSKRWLGRGPYRAYRNRLEGTVFDLHQVAWNDPVPGQSFVYPEFKGYFQDWDWLLLETTIGHLTVENRSGVPFFGLYGPRDGEPPMLAFPDTGLALLDVIPAIGNKFDTPDQLGPQSRTPTVSGVRRGSIVLRFVAK
jgi:hypothetical protein